MDITDISQYRESDGSFVQIGKNCTSYNDQALGSALIIKLLESVNTGANITLSIGYKTNTDAKAMSWLTEEQTATKIMRYMFT
jgi:hypothetical protein